MQTFSIFSVVAGVSTKLDSIQRELYDYFKHSEIEIPYLIEDSSKPWKVLTHPKIQLFSSHLFKCVISELSLGCGDHF